MLVYSKKSDKKILSGWLLENASIVVVNSGGYLIKNVLTVVRSRIMGIDRGRT